MLRLLKDLLPGPFFWQTKNFLTGVRKFYYTKLLCSLGLSSDTAGTSFNALSANNCILEVWEQAADRCAHTMRTLNGAAIYFAAICAHSGHIIVESYIVKRFK